MTTLILFFITSLSFLLGLILSIVGENCQNPLNTGRLSLRIINLVPIFFIRNLMREFKNPFKV